MKKYLTPKTILVFGLITLTTFIAAVFLSLKQSRAAVVVSIPKSNAINVRLGQSILLDFNQEINADYLEIQSIPEESWEISNQDSDTIILAHKLAFHPSTNYILNIFAEAELVHSLTFTTEKSQGDIRLIQTIEDKMKIDYPLSKKLPYETARFKVVYSAPLTLEITSKNPNLKSQELIDAVKSWVIQNGADASTHKYIVAP